MDDTSRDVALRARAAARDLAVSETDRRNEALQILSGLLGDRSEQILEANRSDLSRVDERRRKRLLFDSARLEARRRALEQIVLLPDPVGRTEQVDRRPNGLVVERVSEPIGVILMVYEARPHVTVNAGALAIKSGNTVILRGGSEAEACNRVLAELWRTAIVQAGLPEHSVQVVFGDHQQVVELASLEGLIDLAVPRGGPALIRSVTDHARIPVLKHDRGLCHVYLAEGAERHRGIEIALDSKLLMPEVCNAAETVLVDKSAQHLLPILLEELRRHGVDVHGDRDVCRLAPWARPAVEATWSTEYLDLAVSVRLVGDPDQAISHISTYGSHHTDSVVTDSVALARRFVREVDSAVCLVNASTMFCDGQALGMGAEIGISTSRLHARGPMGLHELTTRRLVVRGEGQTMGGPWTK